MRCWVDARDNIDIPGFQSRIMQPIAFPLYLVSGVTYIKYKSLWQHSEEQKFGNLVYIDSFLSLCVCQNGVTHYTLQRCKSTPSTCVYLMLFTHCVRPYHVTQLHHFHVMTTLVLLHGNRSCDVTHRDPAASPRPSCYTHNLSVTKALREGRLLKTRFYGSNKSVL
jgi:hypothetical protein